MAGASTALGDSGLPGGIEPCDFGAKSLFVLLVILASTRAGVAALTGEGGTSAELVLSIVEVVGVAMVAGVSMVAGVAGAPAARGKAGSGAVSGTEDEAAAWDFDETIVVVCVDGVGSVGAAPALGADICMACTEERIADVACGNVSVVEGACAPVCD